VTTGRPASAPRDLVAVQVHGLHLDPATLAAVIAHAERDFPHEACGVIAGRVGAARLERVCPLRNVQDRYHARDPARYPRSSREAFRVDELERLRLLECFADDFPVVRAIAGENVLRVMAATEATARSLAASPH
jgi:hypothetical protein